MLRNSPNPIDKFYLWEMGSEDIHGFPGAFHGNMQAEYAKRIAKWVSDDFLLLHDKTMNIKNNLLTLTFHHQPEHYAVKKKNIVLHSDVEKVRLDIFDESVPVQHCQKIMAGCGIYFGFHGRAEHASLRQCLRSEEICGNRSVEGRQGVEGVNL